MGVGEPLLNLKLIEDVYRKEDFIKDINYLKEMSKSIAIINLSLF